MIKVGHQKHIRYWGEYVVEKVVKLEEPVECYSDEKGEIWFNPTIVKIKWKKPPSKDKNEFWFPYWITIADKEKYGQFAPMIGENSLLELLGSAIEQDFFSEDFLQSLSSKITGKLHTKQN